MRVDIDEDPEHRVGIAAAPMGEKPSTLDPGTHGAITRPPEGWRTCSGLAFTTANLDAEACCVAKYAIEQVERGPACPNLH